MTVLTTIPNGASNKDIRDTFNSMLSRLTTLEAGTTPVPTPTVTISGAQSHAEGNSGTTPYTYTVTRSISTGAITVPWTFAAGSTSAADYVSGSLPAGGNVAIADGQTSGTIVITVAGDTTVEPDEQFTVTIAAPAGYTAGSSMSATGTILNDDTAPTVTPLPSGIAAMWDAASITGLSNGAAVNSWTDSIAGITAAAADSGTSHTYVANSGGLPAVRTNASAVLATSGSNAANTAMTGNEFGMIVVARAIQDGTSVPCLAASGTGTGIILCANTTQTGRFQRMYPCADAGMRTIGYSSSGSKGIAMDGVNGTGIMPNVSPASGGQIFIGGWQNVGNGCLGKADILAVIVFNRLVTSADIKQVHRRYCDLLGQARPGGATARTVSFFGDSIDAGYPGDYNVSYGYQMAQALGWAWGTWDQLGVAGYTWNLIQSNVVPFAGNISGATGTKNIACAFEWYNLRQYSGSTTAGTAQACITAMTGQDSNREIILGTSTDAGSSDGVTYRQNRTDYTTALVAGLTGVTTLVRIDQDTNIGVQGAAPTNGSANTYYQADGIHLTAAGEALLDNGPHGFRAAVSARLAA